MPLLSGAAGMAWLLAVEAAIKAAASAAITRLVFIAYFLLFLFAEISLGKGRDHASTKLNPVPDCTIETFQGTP
jgi:hypothetical protein